MSLIQSAKLNGHDRYAYLKDILTRLPTKPASRLDELLTHLCCLSFNSRPTSAVEPLGSPGVHGRPQFAKLSLKDDEKRKIAPVHPDF
jgi:hypothetical protein